MTETSILNGGTRGKHAFSPAQSAGKDDTCDESLVLGNVGDFLIYDQEWRSE
jgi:hypothetical protein